MQNIKTQDVLKYTLLPQIQPRMRNLFGTGFAHLAMLMAHIYILVRLLPANHPYGNPINKGRFGIRHVIAEAANNLVLDLKNIDKIFIFFTLLAGSIILFAQMIFLIVGLFTQTAWAFAIPAAVDFFDTADPEDDVAFFLLARVFGVPDFFCSAVTGTCVNINGAIPYPIHAGLHELFRFYSFGLLLVGVLIFLYFLIVVTAETATTGTPFGQRFQNVWVPIRLIMMIGLLVPINLGLNSGQYIVLFSAKMGSSLATNAWLQYNDAISTHPLFASGGANPTGEKETLIGMPKEQSITSVIEMMSLIHTCAYTFWRDEIQATGATNVDIDAGGAYFGAGGRIRPFFVKTDPTGAGVDRQPLFVGTDHLDALDFYNNGDIHIVFGEFNDAHQFTGNVRPYCGIVTIPVSDVERRDEWATIGGSGYVLQAYFELVKTLWFRPSSDRMMYGAIRFGEIAGNSEVMADFACSNLAGIGEAYLPDVPECGEAATGLPGVDWRGELEQFYTPPVNLELIEAWELYVDNGADIEIETEILDRGWGGAGMWFTRVAQLNGTFMEAVLNIPRIKQYPEVMEATREAKRKSDSKVSGAEVFNPNLASEVSIDFGTDINGPKRATILYEVHRFWNLNTSLDPEHSLVYNTFIDAMTMILGVEGVFDIRGENFPTHPLTQLVMIGKGLVESTIRNLAVATATSFMGGLVGSARGGTSDTVLSGISSFFSGTAFIGLTAGVVLFYIVPFMPFVYFFFAVGVWVKTIFEAMVGVPLWALAHLRLDGEGLPGESASNGYFLILEIGLRPILTVFGLVAAIIIFTAQVRVLNFIWDLVIQNSGGYTNNPLLTIDAAQAKSRIEFRRGVIDEFFFTVIYAIIVYMIATACFKLIDTIPQNILRWIGAGVSAFGDTNQETADQLSRYVAVSGMVQGQQLSQGIVQGAGGLGGTAGTVFRSNTATAAGRGGIGNIN